MFTVDGVTIRPGDILRQPPGLLDVLYSSYDYDSNNPISEDYFPMGESLWLIIKCDHTGIVAINGDNIINWRGSNTRSHASIQSSVERSFDKIVCSFA